MKKVSLLCRFFVLLMAFVFPAEMLADYSKVIAVSENPNVNRKPFTKKSDVKNTFYREVTLENYTENPKFKFKVTRTIDNQESTIGWYSEDNNGPKLDDWSGTPGKYWCSEKGTGYFELDLMKYKDFYNKCTLTLTYDKESGGNTYWYVTVKGTEVKPGVIFPDAYYFVSPELTGGEKIEDFKFSPSRRRGGKEELEQYHTFNFRDFLLDEKHKKLEKITYWIERGDGQIVYKAYQETYELGKEKKGTDNLRGNIKYHEAYDCAQDHTGVFTLQRGTGQSYTFFINTTPDTGGKRTLEILVNDKNLGRGEIDKDGYYLVGNFKEADASIDIKPWETDGRREMRKSWFKDGIEFLEWDKTDEEADSILFRATVPKPAAGWSQLYLAVFAKNDITSWDKNIDVAWGKAIRPQVQWVKYDDANGLDGTALHGGLTTRRSNAGAYTEQALNPQVDDSYTSYTFSMNITTSSYNLVFNKGMYIMGPAVSDPKNAPGCADSDGWSSADPYHQTKHALRMYYDQKSRSYSYHGMPTSGATTEEMLGKPEQPIRIEAGEKFLFVYNKDFTKTTFMGDRVSPKSLIKKNEDGTYESDEMNVYNLADNDALNGNHDTQYVNYLRTGNSSKTDYDAQQVRACEFGLPTDYYYVRLYIRQDNDMQKIYYLLSRKYTFFRPYAAPVENTDKLKYYTTFKSFCDYHAVIVPDDIDILYVSNVNKEMAEATLTKYNPDEIDGKRILPAGMPVILAKKTARTPGSALLEKEEVTMEYYEEPSYGENWAETVKDNMLKGQIDRKHILENEQIDGKTYTNLLFGYKKRNGSDKPATIGFYLPGSGECSINTAYLQMPGKLTPTAASKGLKMVFRSGATGVSTIETDNAVADDSYYTLQGTRTARPTTKGIYIHNNKKIIIK